MKTRTHERLYAKLCEIHATNIGAPRHSGRRINIPIVGNVPGMASKNVRVFTIEALPPCNNAVRFNRKRGAK